jgi:hypothetical protein
MQDEEGDQYYDRDHGHESFNYEKCHEDLPATVSDDRHLIEVDHVTLASLPALWCRMKNPLLHSTLQLQGFSEGLATPSLFPVRSLYLRGHDGDCSRRFIHFGDVRLAIWTTFHLQIQPVRGCVLWVPGVTRAGAPVCVSSLLHP